MAATPTNSPLFQAFAPTTGLPLVGGKVYTYVGGTASTPKTTWSDAGKASANTNPVILDANGQAPIYLDGEYKFLVKDSAGNTLYTIDHIIGGTNAFDRPASGITSLPFDDIAATNVQAALEELGTDRLKVSAGASDAQALAGTATTVYLKPSNLAQERILGAYGTPLFDGMLVTSTNAGARTIAIKAKSGNDPSAAEPVTIGFRDAGLPTGGFTTLTLTAATSFTISSGSTLGFSSAVAGRFWVVAFNDGGTFRLGVVNALSGTSIMALRDGVYSSTAEGGAGAADSAQVIYTGTAVSSKALRVLGYIDVTETTAGTWAASPTAMGLMHPGVPLPGDTVQVQNNSNGSMSTGTTAIPNDNTIPQNTEGDQYMSQAITPISAANLLAITHSGNYSLSSTDTEYAVAFFRDSVANALVGHVGGTAGSANSQSSIFVEHRVLAGSVTSTTLKVRAGTMSAGTMTFNGRGGAARFNGVMLSWLEVKELMA